MTSILQKVLVLISAFAVVYVNYVATTGAIGGVTPKVISDKYPTFLTPAGYAFSIWGLIYVGILLFAFYQVIKSKSEYLDPIRILFILTCLANIAWIYSFHNQYIGLSVIAIIVLLLALAQINRSAFLLSETPDTWFVKVPFSIYFGWVSVATIVNIFVFIASLGYTFSYSASTWIACLVILMITIIGFVIREKLNIPFYSLTIAWALTAIGVKQSGKTAVVFACAFATMAMIFSALTFILKENKKLK